MNLFVKIDCIRLPTNVNCNRSDSLWRIKPANNWKLTNIKISMRKFRIHKNENFVQFCLYFLFVIDRQYIKLMISYALTNSSVNSVPLCWLVFGFWKKKWWKIHSKLVILMARHSIWCFYIFLIAIILSDPSDIRNTAVDVV